jgi:uncharacterized protein YdaU (DUF1376 family)
MRIVESRRGEVMRPPFFAFYPADFANDINVEAMSTRAVGAYILLLCKAWQSDPPGSLPNNDQILARLARLDAVEWAEVSAGVLACFELRTDGRLHQPRLRREYDKALKAMTAKRKGGLKGAEVTNARRGDTTGKVSGIPGGIPAGSDAGSDGLETGEIGDGEKKEEEKTPLPPAKPGVGCAGAVTFEVIDVNLWREFAAAWTAASLPGSGDIQRTGKRVGFLQQRLAADDWRARWRDAIRRAGKSARCRGLVGTWKLNLDTFLKDPDMLVRILEGEFDDAAVPIRAGGKPTPQEVVAAKRAERERQKPGEAAA